MKHEPIRKAHNATASSVIIELEQENDNCFKVRARGQNIVGTFYTIEDATKFALLLEKLLN